MITLRVRDKLARPIPTEKERNSKCDGGSKAEECAHTHVNARAAKRRSSLARAAKDASRYRSRVIEWSDRKPCGGERTAATPDRGCRPANYTAGTCNIRTHLCVNREHPRRRAKESARSFKEQSTANEKDGNRREKHTYERLYTYIYTHMYVHIYMLYLCM